MDDRTSSRAACASTAAFALRVLPTIRHKYLDTVVHTGLSVLDGLLRRFDVVLICNNANAPFALVPRLSGAKVALNVDGLEWQRGKWNLLGRWYYQACAWLAPKLPIALVSDARVVARWYRERLWKADGLHPVRLRRQASAARARRSRGSAWRPGGTCST